MVDQIKIGRFLKELRNEKGLTQGQLAEQLNVSNRSVSRWETGSTLPDISLLAELSEFYDVDIKEIINGERQSENMNLTEKETLGKVVEYVGNEKKTKSRKLNKYFIMGFACLLVVILDRQFGILSFVFQKNVDSFAAGVLCSLGLLFEFIGFYNNNHDVTLRERKLSLINNLRKKQ